MFLLSCWPKVILLSGGHFLSEFCTLSNVIVLWVKFITRPSFPFHSFDLVEIFLLLTNIFIGGTFFHHNYDLNGVLKHVFGRGHKLCVWRTDISSFFLQWHFVNKWTSFVQVFFCVLNYSEVPVFQSNWFNCSWE